MHKEELLDLHEQMVTVMEHFRSMEGIDASLFDPYDELEVTPSDVHKSKSEHKHAVFVLGRGLAEALSEDEFSNAGRIGKRMEELADDAEGKI
jgi:hypothetical protein